MNWKRIILFGVGAFLAAEAAAIAVGVPRFGGWRVALFMAAVLIPMIALMSWFAVIQRERTAIHVSLGVLLQWCLSFGKTLLSRMPEPVIWGTSLLICAVVVGISLMLGSVVRRVTKAG